MGRNTQLSLEDDKVSNSYYKSSYGSNIFKNGDKIKKI